jgi:hypothetical protein
VWQVEAIVEESDPTFQVFSDPDSAQDPTLKKNQTKTEKFLKKHNRALERLLKLLKAV